ncbi:MAG: tRNA dimethylallyltransferase [Mariniblastus sp.]|jgi:tRNA dimethylallyltransferase
MNQSSDKHNDEASANGSEIERALACWFLTGATASGKSKVSLELAKLLNAEIISLDSMAIYRGMDIGTAKPNPEDRAIITHHLIDIVDPPETFSVSDYRSQALATIDEIRSRGKEVIFVGGTALYLKSLLRGMFQGPPADWDFRNEIEQEVAEMGSDFLHQRLQMVDPVAAHNLHPNDQRRIIRALEVYKQTGKPISHWQMQFDQGREAADCRVFTLRHARPVLHQRIEQRVDDMFAAGLCDEVAGLLERWDDIGRTAGQAVGYREVIDHLRADVDLDSTIEKVMIRTRRFARHQETWFRGLSECRLIDLESEWDAKELAQRLFELGNAVVV